MNLDVWLKGEGISFEQLGEEDLHFRDTEAIFVSTVGSEESGDSRKSPSRIDIRAIGRGGGRINSPDTHPRSLEE